MLPKRVPQYSKNNSCTITAQFQHYSGNIYGAVILPELSAVMDLQSYASK